MVRQYLELYAQSLKTSMWEEKLMLYGSIQILHACCSPAELDEPICACFVVAATSSSDEMAKANKCSSPLAVYDGKPTLHNVKCTIKRKLHYKVTCNTGV